MIVCYMIIMQKTGKYIFIEYCLGVTLNAQQLSEVQCHMKKGTDEKETNSRNG